MKRYFLTAFLLGTTLLGSKAEISLPRLVGDGMVLQRNSKVNIWGWATPESKITVKVSWDNAKYSTTTDSNGLWMVNVPTQGALTSQEITLKGDGSEIALEDVSVGEVWVCSGQSNMEMPVRGFNSQPTLESAETILNARDYPKMRLFTVKKTSSNEVENNCISDRGWVATTPETVAEFSATAFFFGRALSKVLDIPVGLIHSSWGGSRIEAWMTKESIESVDGADMEFAFNGTREHHVAANLYNGMIAPLTNYTAKGFIWYQGESNISRPTDYIGMKKAMVNQWRNEWGNQEMPFYYVQIAPFPYVQRENTALAKLVEAQYATLKEVPLMGIASTTDIGNTETIHPGHKREVGERLSYMALRNDYDIVGLPNDAPTFKSMELEGDKAIITFNNITTGGNTFVFYDHNEPRAFEGFEVAGDDKVFHKADQVTRDSKNLNKLIVGSSKVDKVVAVRYAFYNIPECNVRTGFGQPLVPFRTDNWD